jgi:TDG/mug DNA glycosylase family protein
MTQGNLPSAVPDVLARRLSVVFCGINPGEWSARAQAPFANPRNDFWRLLHAVGFTPRLLEPHEFRELRAYGIGLTNAAHRTTRGSGELRAADFAGARERLEEIARRLRPRVIAFVGKAAYQGAFREALSTACRDSGWAAPPSSSCPRRHRPMPPWHGTSGSAGSGRCETSR